MFRQKTIIIISTDLIKLLSLHLNIPRKQCGVAGGEGDVAGSRGGSGNGPFRMTVTLYSYEIRR